MMYSLNLSALTDAQRSWIDRVCQQPGGCVLVCLLQYQHFLRSAEDVTSADIKNKKQLDKTRLAVRQRLALCLDAISLAIGSLVTPELKNEYATIVRGID